MHGAPPLLDLGVAGAWASSVVWAAHRMWLLSGELRLSLRSAIILGLVEGKGSLSAISFFRAYPTQEMEVSIPALLNLMSKASSISELVRFFSESPLDGLKGSN